MSRMRRRSYDRGMDKPCGCDQCRDLCETKPIPTPEVYYPLIRMLIEHIARNELAMLEGPDLQPLLVDGSMWPDDIIEHLFQCTKCKQHFGVSVDVYHGRGGRWRAI